MGLNNLSKIAEEASKRRKELIDLANAGLRQLEDEIPLDDDFLKLIEIALDHQVTTSTLTNVFGYGPKNEKEVYRLLNHLKSLRMELSDYVQTKIINKD